MIVKTNLAEVAVQRKTLTVAGPGRPHTSGGMIQQPEIQANHNPAPRPYQQDLEGILFLSDSVLSSTMLSTRAAATTSSTANTTSTSAARATSSRRRSLPVPLPRTQSLSFPSMAIEPAQPKNPTPVIRWLGPLAQADHPKRTSGLISCSPSSSDPPSPCLSLLKEALNEDILPTAPPHARLPSSFYASRALSRPPPFLDNLTRSTLPTASLSPGIPLYRGLSIAHSVGPNDLQRPSAEVSRVSYSPPKSRNSIDTLRSVRDRSIHLAPSVPSPSTTASTAPTSWWWFQGDNKQNVDTLLQEEDRADSVIEEQRNLRKKCKYP